MRSDTRVRVKEFMLSFAEDVLERRRRQVDEFVRRALAKYPFHIIFFPLRYVVISGLERSITAAVGMGFYTGIAKIIAEERFNDVRQEYTMRIEIDEGMVHKVDAVLDELDRGKRTPNLEQELNEIKSASTGKRVVVEITADLYIGDFEYKGAECPLDIQFKTPWPKKEDCVRSKRRLMLFRLGKEGLGFVGFPYNPYTSREEVWWTIKTLFDVDKECLFGRELWDLIGGTGTFDELVEIAREVSEEVRPLVEDLIREVEREVKKRGGW